MASIYFLLSKKELKEKADLAWDLLSFCRVCPRKCGVKPRGGHATLRGVNRLKEKTGFCQMGEKLVINSAHAHFGEESCLVGPSASFDFPQDKSSGQAGGSGTIFFSSCNLACVYCQNFEISQLRVGEEVEIEDLAKMMLSLQNQGCHNINLVSPTIWVPQILKALCVAVDKGLRIPLVYNTGGYDSVETLKLLDGVVDIYMPDIKYSDNEIGSKYSKVSNYWTVVQKAVKEMYRQVGDLVIDGRGLAVRGLLIRHLVLPNNLAGTKKVMKFIAKLSKNSYVNIMDQYYPTNKAHLYPELNRRITFEEFKNALKIAKKEGLWRFDKIH